MIHLQTSLIGPGCAQGKYILKAKGCILAVLRWGSEKEPLADWGPFAYVPIDPAGKRVLLLFRKTRDPQRGDPCVGALLFP